MPSLARLKKRADFLRVAAQRRKWAAPGLILQAAPAIASLTKADLTTDDVVRVGFTVSKKVGNSIERNRARRRLRAAAAEILPLLAVPGIDLVLIGRRETLTRPYSLLLQDLRTALKRVGASRPGEDPAAASATREAGKR